MTASRIGISSACFYPEETLAAIEHCVRLGFRNVEIFMNSFSELGADYLARIRELMRREGVKITSIHPFTSGYEYMLFFSAYGKRASDACDFYRMYFNAARELGAELVVFHGDSTRAGFVGMERYSEVVAMLRETARSEGVILAHENVSSARGGAPEFMRELRRRLGAGNIDFVLDIKQALRAGFEPHEMIEAMGSDIRHVHINDWLTSEGTGREEHCRLPFAGELDLPGIITEIEAHGYRGRYMIEVYRSNFGGDGEITRSLERLTREI